MAKRAKKLTPRELRDRTGKTQQQIADEIGRKKTAVSGWETGRRSPELRLHEVKLMMEAYQTTLDELIEVFTPDEAGEQ